MAPIRVGMVGLSAKEFALVPGAWGVSAFLPTLTKNLSYQLVALCNSSVESARRSIEMHGLPASTKAYGDIEQLAADPEVDMVIISVAVYKHLGLAKPALARNKTVFVEWPLGSSATEAAQMTELARANGLKTIVGLQARADNLVVKLKELIEGGEIGTIVSSSVTASGAPLPNRAWLDGADYFLDMKKGGNRLTINFGHFLDSFTHVLGGFETDTVQAIVKCEVAEVPLISPDGGVARGPQPKNTPDQIFVQGSLRSGAVASLAYRMSEGSVDGVGCRWIIAGTEGEIQVDAEEGQWQIGAKKTLRVKKKGGAKGEAEEVDFESGSPAATSFAAYPAAGVNTALILDAFARGEEGRYADFAGALETHELLEAILRKSGYEY